jgi:hypothetical protein
MARQDLAGQVEPGPVRVGQASAVPAGSDGIPASSGVPLLRRKAVLGAAGAGAAVLLVGAGFLAGSQLRGGDDTTRLVSDQSGPMGGGYGAPFGRGGQEGDQGMPGGQIPGDIDGDANGPQGGAAASSFVTAGQITAISGSSLTLSTLQGGTAKVTTTSSTTVAGTSGGSLSSLAVGQVVFVAGTKASDGSYLATAIMTRPTRGGGTSHGDGVPGGSGADGTGPGSAGGQNSGASTGSGSPSRGDT